MTLPSPDEIEISKLDAAQMQLERAIKLFVDGDDYVSALTLAGAANELLGGAIEAKGWRPSRNKMLDAYPNILALSTGKPPPVMTEKEIGTIINEARNWLKHYNDGEPILMNPENEAHFLISQAVDNYFRLKEKREKWMGPFAPILMKKGSLLQGNMLMRIKGVPLDEEQEKD